jgi:hypothetical protein
MTKKLAALSVVVTLASASVVFGWLTTASSQGAPGFKVFQPYSKGHDKQVDVGSRGFSRGDYHTGYGPLLQNGDRVGHEFDTCTTVRLTKKSGTDLCEGTFIMKGRGKLTVSGFFNYGRRTPHDGVFAVTGGTSDFRSARGTMKIDFGKRGIHFEFNLVP